MELRDAGLELLTTCACEGLRRSARAVTSRYQEALAGSGSGVRPAQLPILVATQLMGPVPVTELARTLVIDRTTLTRNLHGLEVEGLVSIEDGDDRRVRLVTLTEPGRAALETALGAWRGAQAGVADTFGPERLQALVSELAAFTAATRV